MLPRSMGTFKCSSTLIRNVSLNCIRRNITTSFMVDYKGFLQRVLVNGTDGSITYKTLNEHVGEIMLDYSAKKNAISGKMMNDLAKIVDEILMNKDKSQIPFAIILRGANNSFCSGLNLTLTQNELNTPEKGAEMSDFMTDICNTFKQSRCMSICMINGPAVGGGAELVTACDFRLISSEAYIQFIHAKRALTPAWGGISRLEGILGRRKALYYLGTSAHISPNIALEIGLVDEIYDPCSYDEQTEVALRFLHPFLKQPYKSVVSDIKEVIGQSYDYNEMIKYESVAFKNVWQRPNNKNAVSRFLSHEPNAK